MKVQGGTGQLSELRVLGDGERRARVGLRVQSTCRSCTCQPPQRPGAPPPSSKLVALPSGGRLCRRVRLPLAKRDPRST